MNLIIDRKIATTASFNQVVSPDVALELGRMLKRHGGESNSVTRCAGFPNQHKSNVLHHWGGDIKRYEAYKAAKKEALKDFD